MTNANIHPNSVHWRAELRQREHDAQRAATLIEHAHSTIVTEEPHELPGDKAQRLRGAAIVVQNAIAELLIIAGWLEAAQAAQHDGLLPEVTTAAERERAR
jgi:hypothetical protein